MGRADLLRRVAEVLRDARRIEPPLRIIFEGAQDRVREARHPAIMAAHHVHRRTSKTTDRLSVSHRNTNPWCRLPNTPEPRSALELVN